MAPDLSEKLTNKIHSHLARSYASWFLLLVIGVVLDILFPLRIFHGVPVVVLGYIILFAATALIFWAQRTTRNLHTHETLTKEAFLSGPYCYTRTPTHFGLFLLTLGFGIITNAFFIVATSIVSFILGKVLFLKQYEAELVVKYGDAYREYEKAVRL